MSVIIAPPLGHSSLVPMYLVPENETPPDCTNYPGAVLLNGACYQHFNVAPAMTRDQAANFCRANISSGALASMASFYSPALFQELTEVYSISTVLVVYIPTYLR